MVGIGGRMWSCMYGCTWSWSMEMVAWTHHSTAEPNKESRVWGFIRSRSEDLTWMWLRSVRGQIMRTPSPKSSNRGQPCAVGPPSWQSSLQSPSPLCGSQPPTVVAARRVAVPAYRHCSGDPRRRGDKHDPSGMYRSWTAPSIRLLRQLQYLSLSASRASSSRSR